MLAMLAKEPSHGYQLRARLQQALGPAGEAMNAGQIYVTLKRLEQDGLVRSQDVAQDSRPNKKVYELTPAGREQLAAWVTEPIDGPRVRDEFFMKLVLAPLAGLAELALVCVYMAVNIVMTTRWVRPANLKSNALDSRIGGALADAISGNAAVKSFGAEDRERALRAWAKAMNRVVNEKVPVDKAVDELIARIKEVAG